MTMRQRPPSSWGSFSTQTRFMTPVGSMPLGEITRAEFIRKIVHDGYGPEETSAPAVVGGAVVGGVVFGAAGAVVGGLAGSTVKEPGAEQLRTDAVQLIFETGTLNSLDGHSARPRGRCSRVRRDRQARREASREVVAAHDDEASEPTETRRAT